MNYFQSTTVPLRYSELSEGLLRHAEHIMQGSIMVVNVVPVLYLTVPTARVNLEVQEDLNLEAGVLHVQGLVPCDFEF